jgi:hypothetical protein
MTFGLVVMGVIIVLAALSVLGIMIIGSKEDVSHHDTSAENSVAVQAWRKRAERANQQGAQLSLANASAGESASAGTSLISEEDKEAKRQAALARKAARSTKGE